MARHTLDGSGGRPLSFDAGRGEGVVAHDPIVFEADRDPRSRRTGRCRCSSVLGQPHVQRCSTTVKTFKDMGGTEQLRVAEAPHYFGRGRRNSSTRPGSSRGGRSNAAMNSRHSAGESTKRVRSARTRSARSRPLSTRNSDNDSRVAAAAWRKSSSSLAATRRCTRWVLASDIASLYAACAYRISPSANQALPRRDLDGR